MREFLKIFNNFFIGLITFFYFINRKAEKKKSNFIRSIKEFITNIYLNLYNLNSGDVVELVDTLGLEPSAARRGGSTPPSLPLSIKNIYFLKKRARYKH